MNRPLRVLGIVTSAMLLLSACGRLPSSGNPASSSSPSSSEKASPSPSPASILPTLNCRVAIAVWRSGEWLGGWVLLPSASFVPDPTSKVSPAQDAADGTGLSFDATTKRWLPASPYAVRPDGELYAYLAPQQINAEVRIVNAGGEASVLGVLPSNAVGYHLIGVQPEGVYVTNWAGGLWRIDYSGRLIRINAGQYWSRVAGGYAYGPAAAAGYANDANEIDRLDLKTGVSESWFLKPGMHWWIPGYAEDGSPLITWSDGATTEFWLGTTPKRMLHEEAAVAFPSAWGDSHGLWIASANSLYLYSEAGGWEKVWIAPTDLLAQGTNQRIELASGCI